MCDRGSNFRKAFSGFQPLFCFGHRLNNILKRAFFQHQKRGSNVDHQSSTFDDPFVTANTTSSSAIQSPDEISTDDSDTSSGDDDCESTVSLPIARKRKHLASSSSKSGRIQPDTQQVHMKMAVDQVPSSVKQVLRTLNQCKRVVKYVKKVSERDSSSLSTTVFLLFAPFESQSGVNKEIEGLDGSTLHQSSVVRWLSMTDLLESVSNSFKIIRRLLIAKKKESLTKDLDERTIR